MRARYRDTQPEICVARYRLVTEFYKSHPELEGMLRRALNFKNICENIPVRIDEGEVIAGAQSSKFRACALYPENSVDWLRDELSSGLIMTRDIDPYVISESDREYVLGTIDYWLGECMSRKADAQLLDEYRALAGNGVSQFAEFGQAAAPVGHFVAGYNRAIRKGFAAIKAECEAKKAELIAAALPGGTIDQYNFYRAVSIVCDGIIKLTKRYAALASELAEREERPGRRRELEAMAECLSWTVEKPARNFHDALQCLFMYQTALCLDANMHGLSFGRVDMYLGEYLERDLASGAVTEEYAQELTDLFYLKVAEMNKPWSYGATQSNPGYTSGQLMTLGGVKRDGTDASNAATYMMLQSSGRLLLHDPPQALLVHRGTPPELWEAAIATTKLCGGVPTFENQDVIIPALVARGLSLEDARECSCVGCVELSGTGNDWPACGGTGTESYMNLANALLLAINDGFTPVPMISAFAEAPPGTPNKRVGAATGYLYEMTSIEQVMEAFRTQLDIFVRWHHMNINSFEYIARQILPQPLVSATVDGCVESGRDVMFGGAKYNSTGNSGVGLGNAADSLYIINQLCFVEKRCTTRELYDAVMANWVGFDALRGYIINDCRHYGNGYPECDAYAAFAARCFAESVHRCSGPRGGTAAGLYPVTINVVFGYVTKATPDGRRAGEPLADGIAAPQGYDKNGPTQVIASVAAVPQSEFPNGTLMNLKFHPNALSGSGGTAKMTQLMQTYFDLGGMELQINVVSAETLRDAQKNPDRYRDLVVRVAGFSAYFTELHPDGQNDLIRRTELSF
jgi:formate C-acetyltransferase